MPLPGSANAAEAPTPATSKATIIAIRATVSLPAMPRPLVCVVGPARAGSLSPERATRNSPVPATKVLTGLDQRPPPESRARALQRASPVRGCSRSRGLRAMRSLRCWPDSSASAPRGVGDPHQDPRIGRIVLSSRLPRSPVRDDSSDPPGGTGDLATPVPPSPMRRLLQATARDGRTSACSNRGLEDRASICVTFGKRPRSSVAKRRPGQRSSEERWAAGGLGSLSWTASGVRSATSRQIHLGGGLTPDRSHDDERLKV